MAWRSSAPDELGALERDGGFVGHEAEQAAERVAQLGLGLGPRQGQDGLDVVVVADRDEVRRAGPQRGDQAGVHPPVPGGVGQEDGQARALRDAGAVAVLGGAQGEGGRLGAEGQRVDQVAVGGDVPEGRGGCAGELARRRAQDLAHLGGVGARERPRGLRDRHERRALGRGLLLEAVPGGDVADDGEAADDPPAVVAQGGEVDLQHRLGALRGVHEGLAFAAQRGAEALREGLDELGREDLGQAPADDLVRAPAQQAEGRPGEADEAQVGVEEEHRGVGHLLQERSVARLAPVQRASRAAPAALEHEQGDGAERRRRGEQHEHLGGGGGDLHEDAGEADRGREHHEEDDGAVHGRSRPGARSGPHPRPIGGWGAGREGCGRSVHGSGCGGAQRGGLALQVVEPADRGDPGAELRHGGQDGGRAGPPVLGIPPASPSARTQRTFPDATASASQETLTGSRGRRSRRAPATSAFAVRIAPAAPDWLATATVPPPWACA